jgi:hypothetical protein
MVPGAIAIHYETFGYFAKFVKNLYSDRNDRKRNLEAFSGIGPMVEKIMPPGSAALLVRSQYVERDWRLEILMFTFDSQKAKTA